MYGCHAFTHSYAPVYHKVVARMTVSVVLTPGRVTNLISPAVMPLTCGHVCSQDKMAAMVKHLASLADGRLILSFAPFTPALLLLKRIGEFFPKGSKVSSSTPMQ